MEWNDNMVNLLAILCDSQDATKQRDRTLLQHVHCVH